MPPRPLHLQAIDRLSLLGNRSYRNPFLAVSCELFFAPLGIHAGYFEVSISECARGNGVPLYAHNPKWNPSLTDPRRKLLQPLLAAAGRVEVALTGALEVEIIPHPNAADNPDIKALNEALASGVDERFQAEIDDAKAQLRSFLSAAFLSLSTPGETREMQERFMSNPRDFAVYFMAKISEASTPVASAE